MDLIDCSVGDSLHFGDDIRIQLTGRVDGMLYLFIDAKRSHALVGGEGFHASALCRGGHRAHVLALCDGDGFAIGPVVLRFEDVRWRIPGVRALRDIHLHFHVPDALLIRRSAPARVRARRAATMTVIEGVWRQPC